ncbi:PH domain-containing protein [Nocardia coffeae]|uniref:PH domain-containing protein n=1 Tax=Nocardia coffeae TaxID=2873381 RepID=UPI001F45D91D|nr:PH domain-containing protein [Nocardia coffeae]
MTEPGITAGAPDDAPTGMSAEPPWRRLDGRMLLLHPVREVVRFIPVLIVTVIAGSRSDNPMWSLAALAVIVGLALTRWFTTTYRIGPDTVQLRRGLLQRKTLTVPRSRIRSVDVHADLMHRLLGLVVLAIGTGQQADKQERFHLDGVDARQVPELRALLLHDVESPAGHDIPQIAQPDSQPHKGIEIGHWQPAWVRYAPLSLRGLAVIAPIVGLAFKFGIANVLFNADTVKEIGARGAAFLTVAVVIVLATLIVVVTLGDCLRYLTTYFGLRVIDDGRTLHISHGLFTTRQTTLDLARLRGATLKEPLLLRLAGGAELDAIMTGTSSRQKILPQAPRTAVDHTLAQLLTSRQQHRRPITVDGGTSGTATGYHVSNAAQHAPADAVRIPGFDHPTDSSTSVAASIPGGHEIDTAARQSTSSGTPTSPLAKDAAAPVHVALIPHGKRARRRRFTRALTPLLLIAVIMAVIDVAAPGIPLWAWIVLAVIALIALALAQDRYRGLGHAVIPGDAAGPTWLITRNGSLDRDRDCLEAPGIIGWTVRQTFFQRRAGLATLVAATAAGKKRYRVVDVPLEEAWSLIEAVTPGRLGHR